MTPSDTYAQRQIGLHWLVVGLVAFQFFTGGGMASAFEQGLSLEAGATGTAVVHGVIGTSILIAMLGRIAVRRRYGAPAPPRTEPSWLQKISRGNHILFYVVLIGMPLAGLLAVLTGSHLVAQVHAITSKVLLALIAAHILGAVRHLTKRDGVVGRMLPKRTS
ncbi:cytochrome b [Palleronia abyssalis]|uniref:Cytochrome b561 n=1 Tax=Palleronia abyssalis TaxID=1501240 RepID=A0A2R8BWE7_9RHOB|nr:cytochrome b/b6 domain-containing protein [Palleronia abyssalis]SPJ24489.1 Cytochrome b561 [Palleronia abyssalis]